MASQSKTLRTFSRTLRVVGLLVLICALGWTGSARAQLLQNLYPGFLEPANPQVLDAVLFGGGFGSQDYGAVQEGLQLQQTVTPYFGVVGRITGYQLWVGGDFNNPLAPSTNAHEPRLNFARLQGGAQFALYPGTTLTLLGGGDVGDSHAVTIEGDYSSWLFTHTHHPLNFSFSANHNYENHVTDAEIDLRMVAFSTANYLGTFGGGGAVYQGGQITSAGGQGGPDLGIYFRKWGLGIDVQGGYGTAGGFGQLSFIKQFDFVESGGF
jgi:hypothetical protein